jgi:hypothetical protein
MGGFSYARSEQKLKRLAREAKGKAEAGTPREATHPALSHSERHRNPPRNSLISCLSIALRHALVCVRVSASESPHFQVQTSTSIRAPLAKHACRDRTP